MTIVQGAKTLDMIVKQSQDVVEDGSSQPNHKHTTCIVE